MPKYGNAFIGRTDCIFDFRSILELLELLICFVAGNDHDEVSDHNLLTLVPKHQGRDRQKLMREQSVLEEVFFIMKALTDQRVLNEMKAEEWQKLLQRCNALLRLSQYDYRKNQVGGLISVSIKGLSKPIQ